MAGGPVKRVAKAIRDQDRQTADYGVREVEFADVRQVSPLLLELHDANIQLEEEDVIISQDVRVYDDVTGLAEGDTLAVKQMRDGNFLVLDVFSANTPVTSSGGSDATTTTKGIIQLAGDLTGTATSPQIAASAVGTSEIANDAVTAAKIATDAVGSSEIAADAIGASEIAAGAVGTSELASDAVTADKIAADAVGSSEIAADAVGSSEIATGAVTTTEIADATIVDGDISSTAAIAHSKLATTTGGYLLLGGTGGTITGTALSGDATITSGGVLTIANDAVTAAKIATDAVDTAEIKAGAVGNDEVASNAAIAHSKLATTTAGYLLMGGTGGTITGTAMSGDASISSAGAMTVKKFTGPGLGGSSITDVYFGSTTISLSGVAQNNANVTIPWGNSAPTIVLATVGEASNYAAMTSAYTTTGTQGQFNLRVRHTDGTTATTTVTVVYLAIR